MQDPAWLHPSAEVVEPVSSPEPTQAEIIDVSESGERASTGPQVGDPAPQFDLPDAHGDRHTLSEYRGRRVVLYFYPKDDTPGCTLEACGFRNVYSEFGPLNAVVIGVSPDSTISHARFAAKHELPFPLLSDEAHRAAEAYGVWRQKMRAGQGYLGVVRTTFIIDEEGRIAERFDSVKPEGHQHQVLDWLRAHPPESGGDTAGGQTGETDLFS